MVLRGGDRTKSRNESSKAPPPKPPLGSGSGIFGQRFAADGTPLDSEFPVNAFTTGYQGYAAVAISDAGEFVVVWASDGQDGEDLGVFGQQFAADGSPQGAEFPVNTHTPAIQAHPDVAADAAGNFVVVWESFGQDGSEFGIFGQRFDSAGSPVGGEFQANSFATGSQQYPAVSTDADAGFIVTWESAEQDGSDWGIFGQQYASDGSAAGPEFQVNSYTTAKQYNPSLDFGSGTEFVVVWGGYESAGSDDDSTSTQARRFTTESEIFSDGFESGDTSPWSRTVP